MVTLKRIGELEYLEVRNAKAEAKIALQGAHLFFFQVRNQNPLVWVSQTSRFEQGSAIRGGIPICWPWFGDHKSNHSLPKHGFARTSLWEHSTTYELDEETTRVQLRLHTTKESLLLWPYAFEVILDITIGENLTLTLTTTNLSDNSFELSEALHTYFKVADIHAVEIMGLEGRYYYDHLLKSFNHLQSGTIRFLEEIDRVYANVEGEIKIKDRMQSIHILSEGSGSVVVWNPWEKGVRTMPDLSDYKTMVCVETANALDNTRIVAPNEQHTMKVTIKQTVDSF